MNTVCILGLGYIGLPTAAMFATHGKKVFGVDVNKEVIQILNNGGIHIIETGLKEIVHEAIGSGNLSVNCCPHKADAFIIAVPTPFKHNEFGEYQGKKYKLADMRAVTSAAESIIPFLEKGNLVILESTSPVRATVDLVRPILEKSGLKAGNDFYLAYSPERVLPGQILRELVENARVMGGIDNASSEKGKELYSAFVKGEIVLTNSTTAEMVKLMENTYRDVNIAIANEFSRLADRFEVDVWEAISIANRHPRVKILNPGPGVGGHCISVDPWFFVESSPEISQLILTSRMVNDSQPYFIVQKIREMVGELKNKRVTLLGMTYKPDVDDIRESPSLQVMKLLEDLGCAVNTYDPYANSSSKNFFEAILNAELLVMLVGHHEFVDLEPTEIINKTSARIIFDTINCLDKKKWQSIGFHVHSLGK